MEKWKLKAPCIELTLTLEAANNIKIIVFCLRIRPRQLSFRGLEGVTVLGACIVSMSYFPVVEKKEKEKKPGKT